MRLLVEDVVEKTPEFRHIRLESVLFSITRSRTEGLHGQFAKIVPMRFEGGSDIRIYKRMRYRFPPLIVGGAEILYAIDHLLPFALSGIRDDYEAFNTASSVSCVNSIGRKQSSG